MDESVKVESWREDDSPVFRISGELDISNVEGIRQGVDGALSGDPQRAIFDLSGLEFMDSSGIALLLSVAERVPQVELRDPTAIVRQLVTMTGLAEVLGLSE
jgi:anti-anti-sigma factor